MTDKIEQQPPYVLAMVISDDIYMDPATGKKTLLGLFTSVIVHQLPGRINQMVLYLAMTDGHGKTPIKIRLIDAEEERAPIFEGDLEFDFADPRMVLETVTALGNVELPALGEYRFQLYACNTLLMERRIMVLSPPEQRGKDTPPEAPDANSGS